MACQAGLRAELIKVTGQKWFWTFEYPGGEITTVNELVAPIHKPVKLLMSSKDVLHSFFVPAFRVKLDVLPNRYMIAWFEATNSLTVGQVSPPGQTRPVDQRAE